MAVHQVDFHQRILVADVMFEERSKALFCSDLFHHFGDVKSVSTSDLIEPTQQLQQGSLADCMPYTRQVEAVLRALADLRPETLASMHGSSYMGQGDRLMIDPAGLIKGNFTKP